ALAVGADAVWTLPLEGGRLWRGGAAGGGGPPPGGGGVAPPGGGGGGGGGGGALCVLSGTDPPGSERDRTGRLRRLDQRTGKVTTTTPLPDLAPRRAVGPVVGGGAVWLGVRYSAGLHDSGILVRVDPGSGRVVGWLRDPRWS